MKNLSIYLLLFINFFGFNQSAFSANDNSAVTSKSRPKICLVLSGGGARGAAHIGVLKVLEENHIPIDCIAGTSMGALVGAAYASGNSIPELYKWARVINIQTLIQEKPPRAELSMRRKIDDYNIFIGPEFGFNDGKFQISKGLVSGIKIEMMLRNLSKAKGYRNFDELPIPFRAVATDLVTGKSVVFKKGELANVMRASMSIPGAIAPAEFDNMILVDGMLTSNLPIETARAMGADVIIAVNVGTPLLTKDQLNSFVDVTNQMIGILTQQNVDDSLAQLNSADIVISPDLGSFSITDFDNLTEIAALGESSTRKMVNKFKHFAIPHDEYEKLRRKQKIITPPDLRPIDEITFKNLKHVNPEYLRSLMITQPHQPFNQADLDRDLSWIYGTSDFERINYKLIDKPQQRHLEIDAVEKSWGPSYLRFGLGLSSDFEGESFFNLLASYRKTWLNSLGAEWRTDLQIGRTSYLISEFFQPLDVGQNFFIAPHVGLKKEIINLYQERDRVATYDNTSAVAGIDIGSLFYRYGELRLGFINGIMRPELDTGSEIYSPGIAKLTQSGFRASLILDQIDSVGFPRSGWRVAAKIFNSNSLLGAHDNYTKWEANGMTVYTIGDNTLNFSLRAGDKLGSPELPRYDLFQWGGFLQQSGYRTGQLLGDNLKFARLMYYRRVMQGTLFDGAYLGASLEAGKVGKPVVEENPDNLLKSVGLFFAIDSPFGPLYLGHGRAGNDNKSFYFYLGRPFE